MSGNPNAFSLINENIRNAEFERLRGSREAAERLQRECNTALDAIATELGDADPETGALNLDNITSINGSGGEKMEKVVELHSHLSAATDALNELDGLAHSAEWRERLESGTALAPETPSFRPRGLFGALSAAMDGNVDLSYTSGQVRSIDVELGDVLGAAFITSDGWDPEDRDLALRRPDVTNPVPDRSYRHVRAGHPDHAVLHRVHEGDDCGRRSLGRSRRGAKGTGTRF